MTDDLPAVTRENGAPEEEHPAGRERKRLVEADMKRIRLAKAYWHATLAEVQDLKAQSVVEVYLKRISEFVPAGNGFVIMGAPGVGKSWLAAVIAKEATRRYFSVCVISHEELQDLRREDRDYGDGMSLMERVRTVDLAVIDNLNEDFIEDKLYGPVHLEKLVARRTSNRLATVLTTRIPYDKFSGKTSVPSLSSLWGVLQESTVGIQMVGKNLREISNKSLKKSLGQG